MGLRKWLHDKMNNPAVEAFGENYRDIARHTGQNMAWYDTRTIIDANAPEQPQVGYAHDHIAATDPTWKGPR